MPAEAPPFDLLRTSPASAPTVRPLHVRLGAAARLRVDRIAGGLSEQELTAAEGFLREVTTATVRQAQGRNESG